MNRLFLLTCTPQQSAKLLELGISPFCFFWHILTGPADGLRWEVKQLVKPQLGPEQVPAWTKQEIDAFIGPAYAKADLWTPDRVRENSATNPNSYPVFFVNTCKVFENGAQASAEGLIYLLKNEFINPADANERYRAIFLK